VTDGTGSSICLGGTTLRRTRWACFSAAVRRGMPPAVAVVWREVEGKMTPGESRRVSLLSILTERMLVVTPASAPAGHARAEFAPRPPLSLPRRALMTDDLPTLGYPITPTDMALLRFLWAA